MKESEPVKAAPAQPPVVVAEHLAPKAVESTRQPVPSQPQPVPSQPEPVPSQPEPVPSQPSQPEPEPSQPSLEAELLGEDVEPYELEETGYSAVALYDYQACRFYTKSISINFTSSSLDWNIHKRPCPLAPAC